MINIDIEQNKQIETVVFGGEKYDVDFSDEAQKKYSAFYEKINRDLENLSRAYEELNKNPESTGDQLAEKAVEIIEFQKNSNIQFLNLMFGNGEGQKIYEKCGKSTQYLSDKVEELAQAINLKRDGEHKSNLDTIRRQYVRHPKR